MKNVIPKANIVAFFASTVLLAGFATRADDQQERKVVVTTQTQSAGDASAAPSTEQRLNRIIIQDYEPDGKKKQAKESAWLGLAVEESSEALSSQLGLKPGEGLTVNFVAADSPAAKADFHKNDVLVELDGQMLVHPMQLRKLVQMHAVGETVKLTFFRGGKKQTASVTLGKTTWDEASDMEKKPASDPYQNLQNLEFQLNGMNGQLRGMGESLARAGLDKARMNMEFKRTMEQTRKAIQDSMRQASNTAGHASNNLAAVDRQLEALAGAGVDVDKDATVIVRNKSNTGSTVVQTDESGTYILTQQTGGVKTDESGTYILAQNGAIKHLTARDNEGKVLFDGPVDTPAEQEKVPREVWEKAKPMFDRMAAPVAGQAMAQAQTIAGGQSSSGGTMTQTDESGTYILTQTGAKKHLTARDNEGKLLFDGPVDTPAQQKKVPKAVWEKAKPMLDKMAAPMGGEPKEDGKAGELPDS